MTAWFVRGLRRGVVTTRYPASPDTSADGLPAPPLLLAGQLTRPVAEHLVAVCPSRAMRLDGDVLVFDVGACTGCGRCADAEPRAVGRSGQFELAVTSRDHLIKHIPLRREVQP